MTPEQLLAKGAALMECKAEDYTRNPNVNRHENFERSALVSGWFDYDLDKVYVTLIATKLARLASLINTSKKPNNESIEDSFVDLINYCALWGSKRIVETQTKEYKDPEWKEDPARNSLHHNPYGNSR